MVEQIQVDRNDLVLYSMKWGGWPLEGRIVSAKHENHIQVQSGAYRFHLHCDAGTKRCT